MGELINIDPQDIKGKYLTFSLMEEQYGVNVDWILQIIAIPDITKIPRTPTYVKGVINLRGKIIPIMDLRLRFQLPEIDYNERTSVVIVKVKMEKADIFIGFIVDKVSEVLDIMEEEIEKTPSFGIEIENQFILGMAKVKGNVVTLLNVNEIIEAIDLSIGDEKNHFLECPWQKK